MKTEINRLFNFIAENDIDFYFMTTGDSHGCEYVPPHFEVVRYFTGFTGSNAAVIAGRDKIYLWTDGRYFIQAEKELEGTDIVLMRSGNEGVVSVYEFLKQHLKSGMKLALNGACILAAAGKEYRKLCEQTGAQFCPFLDAASLWENRPELPSGSIWFQSPDTAGKSAAKKLKKLRKLLGEKGADSILISSLDEVMWLFNIRGNDVCYNPVAYSYAYVEKESAHLFLQETALDNKLREWAADNNIQLHAYQDILQFLNESISNGKKVLIDTASVNFMLYETCAKKAAEIVEADSPVMLLKAVKNKREIENIKKYFLLDSVAVTKFLYWLDNEVNADEITELDAADKLQELRASIDGYMEDSFAVIPAYGKNAAMAHYEPDSACPQKLKSKGFLLVDSGGQYEGATTDVTRTIVLGELSDEEIKGFTLVAAGWAELMNVRFMEGCTGRNLDILARRALWREGLDYQHGTGHGVGYCLNVHEGPQAIRYRASAARNDGVLKAGMLITDEPGLYVKDSFGIRTENTLLIEPDGESEYGKFLKFTPLTLVPVDRRAIDKKLLTKEQRKYINGYHRLVFEKISPHLDKNMSKWLKKMTKKL